MSRTLNIGPYELEYGLVLAPMAGVTDRPFRNLCRRYGADYAVSEMMSSKPELWGTRKSKLRSDHSGEQAPIGVQIAGSDPDQMAQAAAHNVAQGAQIIDINFGCPARKVCRRAAGSALLEHEDLVGEIIQRVVRAVDVPVTVKIRLGPTRTRINAVAISRIAQANGAQAIAVHGRTRSDRFAGTADYEPIAQVKAAVDIPVIANGDIDSPEKAMHVLRLTGADGLMLGRSVQGNPWLFTSIRNYVLNGSSTPAPGLREVSQIMLEHLEGVQDLYGEDQGARIFRKHIKWYLSRYPGTAGLISQLLKLETTPFQARAIARSAQIRRAA